MSDQVMNESAVVKQGPVRGAVMALPSSTSTSDHLLRRIATLLSILVAGLLTVFAHYASSICITVILAAFLAILFDSVVVKLETLRLPRAVAAAGIVFAGIGLIGLLGHSLYGRAMTFAEDLPVYTSKIQQTIQPFSRRIEKVQQSAGDLTNDVHPGKKVPEVRLQESPTWPAFLIRGVGSVWGALIIAGVVPFLTFFMLCSKNQMAVRINALFSSTIDTTQFITNLNQMIRGFVVGNPFVGSVMAVATTLMLWGIGMKGAIPLGIASGLLNLLPFVGLVLALAGSSCSVHPSVQHGGTLYRHHSDDPVLACRVRKPSCSEICRHSREYRARGGDGWDALLGLVVGCDGLALGCAAYRVHQAGRRLASVPRSLVQHADADPTSDSTLDAIRRNGLGTGGPSPAPSSGHEIWKDRVTS